MAPSASTPTCATPIRPRASGGSVSTAIWAASLASVRAKTGTPSASCATRFQSSTAFVAAASRAASPKDVMWSASGNRARGWPSVPEKPTSDASAGTASRSTSATTSRFIRLTLRPSVIDFGAARRASWAAMNKPSTVRELRQSGYRPKSVKQELRDNLIARLSKGEPFLPGIVGYEDTVVPQIENAILSGQDVVFLGERGQAKTRIARLLVGLLDETVPVVAGCEINDDPLDPVCPACRGRVTEDTEVTWLP